MNEIEQKEINEMAKDLNSSIAEMSNDSFNGCLEISKYLVGLGYRNCKDKVVLERKEYARLHNLEINYECAYDDYREYAIENNKLKEELNDYKQRYESAEKRCEQLVQSSCEALEKKDKMVLSKEEFEKIENTIKNSKKLEKMAIEYMQEELKQASELKTKTIKLAKQETAREIISKMKKYRFHKGLLTIEYEMLVNDLAKQYGVEEVKLYERN